MLYCVKKKTSLMNLKIKPELHFDFKVAAELRGGTMSGLIHQFIAQVVFEEKRKHTAEEWIAVAKRLSADQEQEDRIEQYGTHSVIIETKLTSFSLERSTLC